MENKTVDYFIHESDMIRLERCNKRMLILAVMLFAAVIGTNLLWFILT